MKFGVQKFGIVLMAISISFSIVGCSGNKSIQCANVIKVVNQTVTDTKMITAGGTKGDIATIEKLVTVFEKAGKDMNSVNVGDAKLKTYQGQFVTMYQGATEINKRMLLAIKEKKSSSVYEELNKSRKIFGPERTIVKGISDYCQNSGSQAKSTPTPPAK
jgi:uncharacterized membrane protein